MTTKSFGDSRVVLLSLHFEPGGLWLMSVGHLPLNSQFIYPIIRLCRFSENEKQLAKTLQS